MPGFIAILTLALLISACIPLYDRVRWTSPIITRVVGMILVAIALSIEIVVQDWIHSIKT